MKKLFAKRCLFGLFTPIMFVACNAPTSENKPAGTPLTKINDAPLTYMLPSPQLEGTMSVEQALFQRRSHRAFQTDKEL